MAVPKKRGTSSKTRRRRSHHALKPKTLNVCKNCGRPVEPHRACAYCGNYKDRTVKKV